VRATPPRAGPPPRDRSARGTGKGAEPGADGGGPRPADRPSVRDGQPQPGDSGGIAEEASPEGAAEARAATSNRGSSTQQHEVLREAELSIGGDQVLGDKVVVTVGGRPPQRPRRISPMLLEAARYAFVPPPEWESVTLRATDRGLVVLRGCSGSGRTVAAVRLLLAAHVEGVFELDQDSDLRAFVELLGSVTPIPAAGVIGERPAATSGYLLVSPPDFGRWPEQLWRSLDEALHAAGARMVVTIGTELQLTNVEVLNHVQDLGPAPNATEVFERHLEWLLQRTATAYEERLAETAPVVKELLRPDWSCAKAAQLARLVSEEPDGRLDPERLLERITRARQDDFAIWFERLGDMHTRAFAIALAVLNNQPWEDVSQAARRLHRRLQADEPLPPGATQWGALWNSHPFEQSRERLLQRCNALTQDSMIRSHDLDAPVPATLVSFHDREYADSVLRQAGEGYQLQDTILAWLADLVDNGPEHVRIYAATALGRLAVMSFGYLANRVLLPWTASVSVDRRVAVASALRMVAAHSTMLRPAVQDIAKQCVGAKGEPFRQATGARTYSLALARYDAEAAIRALDGLAGTEDISVQVSVGFAISDLIEDGLPDTGSTEDFALLALQTMLRWTADGRRVATAQLAYIIGAIALESSVEEDVPDGGTARVTWPTFLLLVRDRAEHRAVIVQLWHRAMNEPGYHEDAEHVLTQWAEIAQAHLGVRDPFIRMLRAVAAIDPRTRAILLRCVRNWQYGYTTNPLTDVATAALQVIG
jgi:hypothetical protein